MLSFESDTAHLDVKLLINAHGQLTSGYRGTYALCTVVTFICLLEILHLLPSIL